MFYNSQPFTINVIGKSAKFQKNIINNKLIQERKNIVIFDKQFNNNDIENYLSKGVFIITFNCSGFISKSNIYNYLKEYSVVVDASLCENFNLLTREQLFQINFKLTEKMKYDKIKFYGKNSIQMFIDNKFIPQGDEFTDFDTFITN